MGFSDSFYKKVERKTNVNKETILSLAKKLQGDNLKDESKLRDLIHEIGSITGKDVPKEQEDKIIITKRCIDVDATLKIVNKELSERILEYYDFRIEKDIHEKRKILKDLDLYIEKNIDVKSFDRETDGTIGVIVNKMGINHPIREEKYKNLSEEELLKWYDKCFLLMLYVIRRKEVKNINEERKKFELK